MAGTRLDYSDLDAVQARLDGLLSMLTGSGRRELFAALGAEGESQTRRRIAEEKTAPDGTPWPEWSADYARTRHDGHSLLMGEGGLLDSIESIANAHRAEVGSNLVTAAIHQHGGDEVGIPIPARPYLGLSDDNLTDMQAVIDGIIREHLEAGRV